MILVDTSVWIDHLSQKDDKLYSLLLLNKVCIHPFIIGELACGNLHRRTEILAFLNSLPKIKPARDEECFRLLTDKKLYGIGIGFIDIHLIAAAILNNTRLFSRDKILYRVAKDLDIHFR
jgi:predicted nucleic acid-binding protein